MKQKGALSAEQTKLSIETLENQTLQIPITIEQSGEFAWILESHSGDLQSRSVNF